MTKVADMIGDYADPLGSEGYSVEHEVAVKIAGEMRRILNLDLDEVDIALGVEIYNRSVPADEMIAAWMHLNAGERASWRMFVNYEEWRRNQELKRAN